jgi:hypothetical protein
MSKNKLRKAYRNGKLIRGIGTWIELRERFFGQKGFKLPSK